MKKVLKLQKMKGSKGGKPRPMEFSEIYSKRHTGSSMVCRME